MSIKNYLFPEIQKIYYSPINGEIQLIKFAGDLQLNVDGLLESGAVMARVWRDGLTHLLPKTFIPKSILMLGFAGGSAAKMLADRYPGVKITGVEIDPMMIQIAKDHFKIGKIPNLEIINQDAIKFINDCHLPTDNWDLVLADCFKGFDIPAEFSDIKLLKKAVSLTDNFLINRLYWDEHIPLTNQFLDEVKKHFSVATHRSYSNLVIKLQKDR